MIKKFAFAFLFLGTLPGIQAATIDLKATESATLADGPIKVVAKLERLTAGDCPSAGSWRWGSELSCPSRRIALLEVVYQGQQAFVPYSAFADLGNPSSISVERGAKGVTYSINIKGGDAATSYAAVLKFKATLLLEKIVRHGEFPNDAWEKTIYKFNVIEYN